MAVPETLLSFARKLRNEQTAAEQLLWQVLRGRRFCGVKFRRQHPIGGYILDFYCHEEALAIELDGGGHNEDDQQTYDEERTKVLNGAGVKIVRFWNNEVFNSLELVLEEIHRHLIERSSKS